MLTCNVGYFNQQKTVRAEGISAPRDTKSDGHWKQCNTWPCIFWTCFLTWPWSSPLVPLCCHDYSDFVDDSGQFITFGLWILDCICVLDGSAFVDWNVELKGFLVDFVPRQALNLFASCCLSPVSVSYSRPDQVSGSPALFQTQLSVTPDLPLLTFRWITSCSYQTPLPIDPDLPPLST